jgi:hypothetical protein
MIRLDFKVLLWATTLFCGLSCSTGSTGIDDTKAMPEMVAADLVAELPLEADLPPEPETVEMPAADYLVISADDLWDTATAFADYRTTTGHTVRAIRLTELLTSPDLPDNLMVDEIVTWVREAYAARPDDRPLYLLLIGDAVEANSDPTKVIPVGYWSGGWEPCFGDNAYADMNYDHVPDLAVGRIPVSDNATGLDVLDRIKKHEAEYSVGPWNRRLGIYAGEGGFGEDIDFFIETIAQKGLESVPYEYSMSFAYDNADSTYYYAPFQAKVLDMVADGALLVTFMGHGGGELDVYSLADVTPAHRQPMYAWFACSTGDFCSSYESDAEEVFKQPNGPIATLVSTGTTHPYANAINALEIEAAIFEERPATYGEAIMAMKWRSKYHTSDLREMIDEFARMNMPESEMVETVNDHMYSYNLLGDPAVRIRFPMGNAAVDAATSHAGKELAFSGTVDNFQAGTATVELVAERASIIYPIESIENPTDPANQEAVQQNWNNANNKVAVATEVKIVGGSFTGTMDIPATTPPGNYHLTIYCWDVDKAVDGVGSVAVKVKKL